MSPRGMMFGDVGGHGAPISRQEGIPFLLGELKQFRISGTRRRSSGIPYENGFDARFAVPYGFRQSGMDVLIA